MKKVKFYYFTGSGNTKRVMEAVAGVFEKKGYACDQEAMEDVMGIYFDGADYVGLFFPVAMQSTYANVWDFIESMPRAHGKKIFMVDTMQAFSGGIVGPVKKILEDKGYNCIGAKEVKMASSMSTSPIDALKFTQKNDLAVEEAKAFAEDLLKGKTKWNRVPVLSDGMRNISKIKPIWRMISKMKTIDHDVCVHCGICEKRCPVGALSTVDGKVTIDHNKCVSCMRCLHVCPQDAFSLRGEKICRCPQNRP